MGLFDFITAPISNVISGVLGLGGSLLGTRSASNQAEANTAFQKEFAQQGIRWRVADAKAAGINPLVALGSPPVSYQPQSVGYGDYGLGAFGQSLSRAVSAMKTKEERQQEINDRNHKVQMDWYQEKIAQKNLGLLSLEEIAKQRELLNQPGMPAVNSAGVISGLPGQTGVNNVPAERIVSGSLGVEAGAQPMQKMSIDSEGRIYFPLGKAVEESLENDFFEKYKYLGNRAKDAFFNVGRGLVDKVKNLPDYDRMIEVKRSQIARDLGIPLRCIGYSRYTDNYFVNEEGKKLINRGR